VPAIGSIGAPLDGPAPPHTREDFRYLGRHTAGKPEASAFEAGAPAVPYVRSNDVLSVDRKNPFDDHFGNWTTRPVVPSNGSLSPDRQDSRFGNWSSSPAGFAPRDPNMPVRQPDPGSPRGMIDGSSPMGGLPGRIAALSGIDPDNPDQPVPQPGGLLALLLAAQHSPEAKTLSARIRSHRWFSFPKSFFR
jgi:hypothetical protein